MAKLRVKTDGEEIIIYQAYNPETEVRLSLDEAEAFVEELEQVKDEAVRCSEHRLAEEVQKDTKKSEGRTNRKPQVFDKDGME